MSKATLLIAIFTASVLTRSSIAQEISSSEQLRRFGNRMVDGTWHQVEPEEPANKHSYKWLFANQYLLVYMENEGQPDALAVAGVDPETKLQTWWRFQADGDVRVSTVKAQPESSATDSIEMLGDRAAATGKFKVAWKDADTLEISPHADAKDYLGQAAIRSRWERSSKTSDLSWISSEAPKEIPTQLSLTRSLSGNHWMDGVMPDGTKFIGSASGKWILNGKFHVFTATTTFEDQSTWGHLFIEGIDPQTQQATSWEFSSSGSKSVVKYSDDGMTIYGDNTRANGDKYTFKGTFTVDGDRVRYESKIGQEGEEALPYAWNYRKAD